MSLYVHRQEVNRWDVREVVILSGRNKSPYVCKSVYILGYRQEVNTRDVREVVIEDKAM